jgi:tetratricopeptide (TPR) repeat protein
LEQALEALTHLPPDRPMLEQAVDLRGTLSVALELLGQGARGLTHLREAETLAAGLADHRRLGRLCHRLASTLHLMQDYEAALAYCQRAHTIATALGDVDLQVWVNYDMSRIYKDLGDYRQAMAYSQQVLTALQGEQRSQSFSGVVILRSIVARVNMVVCLSDLGRFADAVAQSDEALQVAEAGARTDDRLGVYSAVGYLHVCQGTLHQATPLLERAVALSQDANIPIFYSISAPFLALAYALAGRATDALAMLGQVGGNTDVPPLALICGEAYLHAGCVEEAHRLAQRGLAHTRHHKMRGSEARALWLLGEIAMHHDPPDVAQAEAHYQQSLALAEDLGMRPLQAHCHLGLGTLYTRTGQQEQAHANLSTAIELYRAMAMLFWLPQAEVALAQVEGQ